MCIRLIVTFTQLVKWRKNDPESKEGKGSSILNLALSLCQGEWKRFTEFTYEFHMRSRSRKKDQIKSGKKSDISQSVA